MFKRIVVRTTIILLVVLVCGGLVGFNLFRDKMIQDFFAKMPQPTVTVSAVQASRGPWREEIEAIGSAKASQGVDIAVQTSGVVTAILVGPNQRVSAGQTILRIDDAIERAQLRAAEADLSLAQAQLRRQTELRERGVVAQANFDEASARVASAGAAVDRIRALIEQKSVGAPFAGVVGIPRVDVGAYLQPGTVVVSLQDLDTMQADFTVSEQRAGRIRIGQPVMFTTGTSDAVYSGRIIGIDPKVDRQTRLVSVRAEISDTKGGLRPGEFVRARILLPEEDNVLSLPQTAIISSLYGDFAYRIEKGEGDKLVARQVFVKIGRRSGGVVEIVSGIEAGQTIATSGQNKLQNGAPVAIDNSVDPAEIAQAAGKVVVR